MGTRGSVSAEQFIKKNYAVLFLHRKRSLTPYERKFHNTNLLDLMHYTDESHESFQFETTNKINMKELFDTYNDVKEKNLLLKVEYNTIFDYLSLLDYTSNAIKSLKRLHKITLKKHYFIQIISQIINIQALLLFI